MSGNAAFEQTDTALISIAHVDAPEVVTSAQFDEVLAETYARVGAQPGLLESLAGIRERRWWPEGICSQMLRPLPERKRSKPQACALATSDC